MSGAHDGLFCRRRFAQHGTRTVSRDEPAASGKLTDRAALDTLWQMDRDAQTDADQCHEALSFHKWQRAKPRGLIRQQLQVRGDLLTPLTIAVAARSLTLLLQTQRTAPAPIRSSAAPARTRSSPSAQPGSASHARAQLRNRLLK